MNLSGMNPYRPWAPAAGLPAVHAQGASAHIPEGETPVPARLLSPPKTSLVIVAG